MFGGGPEKAPKNDDKNYFENSKIQDFKPRIKRILFHFVHLLMKRAESITRQFDHEPWIDDAICWLQPSVIANCRIVKKIYPLLSINYYVLVFNK